MAKPTVKLDITLYDDGTAKAAPYRFVSSAPNSDTAEELRPYPVQNLTGGFLDSAALLIGGVFADAEMAAGEFKAPRAR